MLYHLECMRLFVHPAPTMRSTKGEGDLLEVASSGKTTMTNDKLISNECIAGGNDSVPSTHCSDEESHETNCKYPEEHGVEIVSIRRVSSNTDENEKSIRKPIKMVSSKLITKKSIEPGKKASSKTSKRTNKQLFRGLFVSKPGTKKPRSQQSQEAAASTKKPPKPQLQQTEKEAAPPMQAIMPGPSALLRKISISVELRPSIDDDIESPKVDPEKEVTTSVSVMGTENEYNLADEALLQRIVTASDLAKLSVYEPPALAKAGEMSAKSDTNLDTVEKMETEAEHLLASNEPILNEVKYTEARAMKLSADSDSVLSMMENMASPNETIEIAVDGTTSSPATTAVEKNAPKLTAESDSVLSTMENMASPNETIEIAVDGTTSIPATTAVKKNVPKLSAESDSVLSTMENMASPNETIEIAVDGTTSISATTAVEKNAPIVIEEVAPTVKTFNILDTAGIKVDALVDAFFLMTSCVRIDSACMGTEADPSIDSDTLRRILSDDYDTLRSDADDDATFLSLDNSLLEDDDTLLTFLEDDGTLGADDDTLRPSEEVRKAVRTLKRYALRLGVSEAELLQRIRGEQEKRKTESTQESPPADDS